MKEGATKVNGDLLWSIVQRFWVDLVTWCSCLSSSTHCPPSRMASLLGTSQTLITSPGGLSQWGAATINRWTISCAIQQRNTPTNYYIILLSSMYALVPNWLLEDFVMQILASCDLLHRQTTLMWHNACVTNHNVLSFFFLTSKCTPLTVMRSNCSGVLAMCHSICGRWFWNVICFCFSTPSTLDWNNQRKTGIL